MDKRNAHSHGRLGWVWALILFACMTSYWLLFFARPGEDDTDFSGRDVSEGIAAVSVSPASPSLAREDADRTQVSDSAPVEEWLDLVCIALDSAERPLPGADVKLSQADSDFHFEAQTDQTGVASFSFPRPSLRHERIRITVECSGYVPAFRLVTMSAMERPVVFSLPDSGQLLLRVVDKDSTSLPSALVLGTLVAAAEGIDIPSDCVTSFRRETNDRGITVWDGAAPGRWRLRSASWRQYFGGEAVFLYVAAGEITESTIPCSPLDPLSFASGILRFPEGSSLDGVCLRLLARPTTTFPIYADGFFVVPVRDSDPTFVEVWDGKEAGIQFRCFAGQHGMDIASPFN